MIYSLFMILFMLIASSPVFSAAIRPYHFPNELLYQGAPIPPGCFSLMGRQNKNHVYDLRECSSKNDDWMLVRNDFMDQKGFYGGNWQYPAYDKKDALREGFAFYKAWPAGESRYWVLNYENNGGSGDFSVISLVTRIDEHHIKIESVDGGDRCNGGIHLDEPEITPEGLHYTSYMTPGDFLEIAETNPKNLRAYRDLEACAVCCTAKMEHNVDTRLNISFRSIELVPEENAGNIKSDYPYQDCFNKIKAKWIGQGKSRLSNMNMVRQFMNEFNAICVELNQ